MRGEVTFLPAGLEPGGMEKPMLLTNFTIRDGGPKCDLRHMSFEEER